MALTAWMEVMVVMAAVVGTAAKGAMQGMLISSTENKSTALTCGWSRARARAALVERVELEDSAESAGPVDSAGIYGRATESLAKAENLVRPLSLVNLDQLEKL